MRENQTNSADTQVDENIGEVLVFNRRREPRADCERPGYVYIDEASTVLDCTFKDLSWFGARLKLDGNISLPNVFRIAFSSGGNIRSFYCEPVWRDGNDVGVLFSQDLQELAS